MTLRIPKSQADLLGLDLHNAVVLFAEAREAHARTVNRPAPSAHPLVEDIVRNHGGAFEVFDDRTPGDHRQELIRAVSASAQTLAAVVLSPARQQLAAIDHGLIAAKDERTPEDNARLAQIQSQFASIAAIQRHAAALIVEIDELPESALAGWVAHSWPQA